MLIGLAVLLAVVVFVLLDRPGAYVRPEIVDDNQVSPYLTHELLPQLYNGAQRQEPFELVIPQEKIGDIVALSKWPRQSDGVRFSMPVCFFVPDKIILMSMVSVKDVEFVVSLAAEPSLDRKGLLNLRVAKVKVGAMNITLLAKAVARKMYQQRIANTDTDTDDIEAKIVASLLNDEPFEPVFAVEDKKVRIERISVGKEQLTIGLVPANK